MTLSDVNLRPTAFPSAFQWSLSDYIEDNLIIDEHGKNCTLVLRRALKATDPDSTIAVVERTWGDGVYAIGQNQSVTSQYLLEVWAMVKGVKEEEAAQRHSVLARNVRRLIAEDTALRTLWSNHIDSHGLGQERYLMHHLRNQEFHANNIKAQFMYLSVATIEIVTENVNV